MSEQLKHIFESSACLSRRQLKDYATGTMSREECYAVEHHVNTCFFCSEALDGMMEHSEALLTVEQLNTGFLKDHFSLTNPQIHLNSLAPAAAAPAMQKRSKTRGRVQPLLLKPSSIAAAILLGLGVMWYLEFGNEQVKPRQVASATVAAATDETPVSEQSSSTEAVAVTDVPNSETASQLGLTSRQTEQRNFDDDPQKVQPLIITDPKAGKDKQAAEAESKSSVAADAALAKTAKAKREEINTSTISLPTTTVEKLPRIPSAAASFNEGLPSTRKAEHGAAIVVKDKVVGSEGATNSRKENSVGSADASAKTLKDGDELYDAGEYKAAAISYKKQMNSSDSRTSQHATLMAAKSYIKLGQKDNAIKMLRTLAEEGSGTYKRQAKRMLKDLED